MLQGFDLSELGLQIVSAKMIRGMKETLNGKTLR